MYSIFGFILLLVIVDSIVAVRHQLDDDDPFIVDAKEKVHDKFMLIPSIGFETNDGGYTLLLNGWHYEPLTSSMRRYFLSFISR